MCTRPYMKEGPIKCEWKHGESVSNRTRCNSSESVVRRTRNFSLIAYLRQFILSED